MHALTLESVCNDFETWRTTRGKVGKIPNYLWDKALTLLEHYPIGEVTKTLRLSGGQVSTKLRARKEAKCMTDNVSFVELPNPCKNNEAVRVNFDTKIELKRLDGASIIINNLSESTLMLVLNKFMQG